MSVERTLQELVNMADEISATNSKNEKIELLKKHLYGNDELQKIVSAVYSPFERFGVTSKSIKGYDGILSANVYSSLSDLLTALANDVSGHQALADTKGFVTLYNEYADILYKVFNKDLEMRADTSSINKAIPKLVPAFEVTLAQDYRKRADKMNLEKETWFASQKYDGIRVITICNKDTGEIKSYSRNGHEFTSLSKIQEALKPTLDAADYSFVLDGEICVVREDGTDDFKAAVSQIKRKTQTMENPRYYVFDCLLTSEFEDKKGTQKYSQRMEREPMVCLNERNVCTVPYWPVESHEDVAKHAANAEKMGWEGIMLRKDCGYEGKRTNNLVKVKPFKDFETRIDSAETDEHRIIVDGQQVKKEVLARVYITYKGNKVGVGSGFSKEERIYYATHPEELIGKVATIQFFEESKDKNGKVSLRFPTIKYIHGDRREV